MLFNMTTEQCLRFNDGLAATAKAVMDDIMRGAIAEGDSRAVEARMGAYVAGFDAPLPPVIALAFMYGKHVRSIFVWQHGPHAESVDREPCDHFLGSIQAPAPFPASNFVDFWYCDKTGVASSFCAGRTNRGRVEELCAAMNDARSVADFERLPLDLCIAARLARRAFAN